MKTIIYLTLLHSLWQGLLLAIATFFVLIFTQRKTAAVRYNWLTGCLFSFAAGSLVTIIKLINNIEGIANAEDLTIPIPIQKPSIPSFNTWADAANYLNTHAAYVVFFWFLMVAAKSLQLLLGLQTIHRLKNHSVYDAGNYWQQRVNALSAQLGIDKKVKIMQSALAKAPLAIGHFKPLILIPLGLINNLSVAEVEAILSHELAHIKRRDFLVNMLQSVLEILFFFNPAVLWINKLIREEREHCCDDLALASNVSVGNYINALVSCQSFHPVSSRYAMAFAGPKNQLLDRVRRLLNQGRSVKKPVKFMLAFVLFTSVIMVAALVKKTNSAGTYTIVRKSTVKNASGTTETIETVREEKQQIKPVCSTAPIDSNAAKSNPFLNKEAAAVPNAAIVREVPEDAKTNTSDAIVNEQAEVYPVAAVMKQEECKPSLFTEQDGRDLRNDLAGDGLITNPAHLSYILNSKELIINDVKQPEEVHQKYVARYVKYPGRSILYQYNYTSSNNP